MFYFQSIAETIGLTRWVSGRAKSPIPVYWKLGHSAALLSLSYVSSSWLPPCPVSQFLQFCSLLLILQPLSQWQGGINMNCIPKTHYDTITELTSWTMGRNEGTRNCFNFPLWNRDLTWSNKLFVITTFLFCSLLDPKHLESCLANSRCPKSFSKGIQEAGVAWWRTQEA